MGTRVSVMMLLVAWLVLCADSKGQDFQTGPNVAEPPVARCAELSQIGSEESGADPSSEQDMERTRDVEVMNGDVSALEKLDEVVEQEPEVPIDNSNQDGGGAMGDKDTSFVSGFRKYGKVLISSMAKLMSFQLAVNILVVCIGIGLLSLIVFMFCKSPSAGTRIHVTESILAFLVLLLVGMCAYHLISQIIQLNRGGHIPMELSMRGFSRSVLVAYEKLSDEMGRWFSLFAVLGVFFGLVLPIGAYFLQIKAVDRHEERMSEELDIRLRDAIEKNSQELTEKVYTVKNKLFQMKGKISKELVAQANSAEERISQMKGEIEMLSKKFEERVNKVEETMGRSHLDTCFINFVQVNILNLAATVLTRASSNLSEEEKTTWEIYLLRVLDLIDALGNIKEHEGIKEMLGIVCSQLKSIKELFSNAGKYAQLTNDIRGLFGKPEATSHINNSLQKLKQEFKNEIMDIQWMLADYGIDLKI